MTLEEDLRSLETDIDAKTAELQGIIDQTLAAENEGKPTKGLELKANMVQNELNDMRERRRALDLRLGTH
jgi:hypothetical protein